MTYAIRVPKPPSPAKRGTAKARNSIARFVDTNVESLTRWLAQQAEGIPYVAVSGEPLLDSNGAKQYVVKPDAGGAIRNLLAVCEYHLPKLSAVAVSGDADFRDMVAALSAGIDPAVLERRNREVLGAASEQDIARVLAGWSERVIDAEVVVAPQGPQEAPTGDDRQPQHPTIPTWLLEATE